MTAWVANWLRAFGLTLLVEAAVAIPVLRRFRAATGPGAAAVVLGNLATHPLVWFLFPGLSLSYPARLAASELFAAGVEGAAYAVIVPSLGARRAMFLSLVANAASMAAGMVLRAAHLLA